MKAYLVTCLIIDLDDVGEEIKVVMENVRYPNHCLAPEVLSIRAADVGEWHDDHPLNQLATRDAALASYFPEKAATLTALRARVEGMPGRSHDGCGQLGDATTDADSYLYRAAVLALLDEAAP